MARPTLKDIAAMARVSEMTVSRVLRGKGEASAHTKARVMEAANTLGYVPNRIAGALSSRSVNLVGVVVPSISSSVFSEVLTGVSDVLRGSGLQAVFGVSEYDLGSEENVIREMLSWRPSGLIVAGLEHTETARRMMEDSQIPIAEIMDTDGTPVDINVGLSHHAAGFAMGQAVVAKGYRKIGMIGTKMVLDFRAQKRFDGFKAALAEGNLQVVAEERYEGTSSLLQGKEMTKKMLSRADLDFIYYSSDTMSCGGLLHCVEAGISVPDQLGMAGFNGLDYRLAMPLAPATINAYRFEIGRKAAELILAAHAQGTRSGAKVEFSPEVDAGQTL